MIILPAIDLRAGRVVRLRQGRADEQVIYSDDPAAVAARWEAEGATWLHVVDLDGALGEQRQPNAEALARIRAAVKISIQFGGGLRDMESIARVFEMGVYRAVIGTMAVEKLQSLAAVVERFGGERIVAAMDAREGRVATHGWRRLSSLDTIEFGKRMHKLGIHFGLVTDIVRDGMLTGVDADSLAHLARETGLRVIASGGIATLEDLKRLAQHENDGIEGAIVGQALYSGVLDLGEAIRALRPPS